eukprot:jgi/Mesen1/8423/ME000472S07787
MLAKAVKDVDEGPAGEHVHSPWPSHTPLGLPSPGAMASVAAPAGAPEAAAGESVLEDADVALVAAATVAAGKTVTGGQQAVEVGTVCQGATIKKDADIQLSPTWPLLVGGMHILFRSLQFADLAAYVASQHEQCWMLLVCLNYIYIYTHGCPHYINRVHSRKIPRDRFATKAAR